jgi:hypothetical protein
MYLMSDEHSDTRNNRALDAPSAIHLHATARHIARLLTREETRHIRHIRHLREPAHRDRSEQWRSIFWRVWLAHHEAQHCCLAEGGRDCVHPDPVFGVFDGEAFCCGLNGAFRGAVPGSGA